MIQATLRSDRPTPWSRAIGWAWVVCIWALAAAHVHVSWSINAPGHLSMDALMHLAEAHTKKVESFHPVFVTWWMGVTNTVLEEGGGFALTTTLTHGLAIALCAHVFRPSVLGFLVIIAWAAWPNTLLYNGIVWKDVLVANWAVLAAGVLMLYSQATQTRTRWILTGVLWLLGIGIVLARQNGLLFAMPMVAAWAWCRTLQASRGTLEASPPAMTRRLGLGFALRTVAATAVLGVGVFGVSSAVRQAYVTEVADAHAVPIGLLVLANWDVAGIVAHAPKASYAELGYSAKDAAALDAMARKSYVPGYMDFLNLGKYGSEGVHQRAHKHWLSMVARHPLAYIEHRFTGFAHAAGAARQTECSQFFWGVAQPPESISKRITLQRQTGLAEKTEFYQFYHQQWQESAAHNHVNYMLVLAAALALAVFRGVSRHAVVVAAAAGALAFCLSFALIGVACDFRYLYLGIPMAFWVLLYAVSNLIWRPRESVASA
jgi:hypothetical protein